MQHQTYSYTGHTAMTPEQLIQDADNLVSLPDAVLRINEMLESDKATLNEIGEVVSHDPALSAKLLKLVNSAFYSFPANIDTVSRAISLIGTNELRSLALASSVGTTFDESLANVIDMEHFWRRSVFCGLIAKHLTAISSRKGKGESQFVSGLLHDIGLLVLVSEWIEKAQELITSCKPGEEPTPELEQEVLGFTLAQLSAELLRKWNLPKSLSQPIAYQHNPEAAGEYQTEAEVLKAARAITRFQSCDEDELCDVSELDPIFIDGKPISADALKTMIVETNVECLYILAIINPSAAHLY